MCNSLCLQKRFSLAVLLLIDVRVVHVSEMSRWTAGSLELSYSSFDKAAIPLEIEGKWNQRNVFGKAQTYGSRMQDPLSLFIAAGNKKPKWNLSGYDTASGAVFACCFLVMRQKREKCWRQRKECYWRTDPKIFWERIAWTTRAWISTPDVFIPQMLLHFSRTGFYVCRLSSCSKSLVV